MSPGHGSFRSRQPSIHEGKLVDTMACHGAHTDSRVSSGDNAMAGLYGVNGTASVQRAPLCPTDRTSNKRFPVATVRLALNVNQMAATCFRLPASSGVWHLLLHRVLGNRMNSTDVGTGEPRSKPTRYRACRSVAPVVARCGQPIA